MEDGAATARGRKGRGGGRGGGVGERDREKGEFEGVVTFTNHHPSPGSFKQKHFPVGFQLINFLHQDVSETCQLLADSGF